MKRQVFIETQRIMDEDQFQKWSDTVKSMLLLSPTQIATLLTSGHLVIGDESGSTTYRIEKVN